MAAPLTATARPSALDRPVAARWQRFIAAAFTWEFAAYAAIILIGFLLRIWDVGGRAMHHDESLHAYYSWLFFTGKGYTYDPLMHGPFQFEIVPIFYLIFGAGEMSARLLAVLLGTILIGLPYFLRRYLTVPGALLAAALLAISPAMVYFSRFIRDDIYVAAFSLMLFIGIVRYIESHRPGWLYLGAAAAALAMASMEAAYLTFFAFGSFLIYAIIRERIAGDGPVLRAVRATSLDTWLTAFAIFLVLTVLFYSTFFTNPYGIWDTRYPLFVTTPHGLAINPNRQDIIGGIGYWQAQHYVARGGQPWFYYLLLLPLYEQLALLFGVAGMIYAFFRRSLVMTFLAWWAVMAFGLYSWAGEKMPWLVIHIALPLMLLAGFFLGSVLRHGRRWQVVLTGAVFAVLLIFEVHSTWVLNFVDGANPTEMLIYVQTSQDVPHVASEIKHMAGWPNIPVGLDSADVGGWPFQWYLRDDPDITQTANFAGPVCNGQYCPVLLMLGPEYDTYQRQLQQHYVVQKYRWNWWFPEDYKVWFPSHWGAFFSGQVSAANLLGTATDWSHVWNWLMYRRPFGPRDARWMYVAVRRDLVPGAKNFSTGTSPNTSSLPYSISATIAGQPIPLDGPRGLASDSAGNLYVADTLNHQVDVFSPSGRELRRWGTAGSAPGQFSANDSPLGIAVGRDGFVYVADTWNQRIEVFTTSGHLVRQWGGGPIGSGPGQFYGPRSVAVSPSGTVYVADTGNKRIEAFSAHGSFKFSFGTAGSGPAQFNEPSSVAVAGDGTVYVADFWNQRIQAFTPTGTYIRSWSVPDWTPQSYDEPYITIDPSTGDIVAANPEQGGILEYSPTGRLIGSFSSPSLTLPIGVAFMPNRRIALTDATGNHVVILSPTQKHPSRKPSNVERSTTGTTTGR